MTTINLYQNQQEKQRKSSSKLGSGGFFFSLGIFIVTLLALAGLKFAVSLLAKQNEALATTIQAEKESMAGLSNLEQIVDMQTRLKQIKNNLKIENNQVTRTKMTQVLDHLSAETDARIAVSTYKYENNDSKITLTFEASNFSDIARQILNFKGSDYFTNVNLIKLSRGVKSISCSIEMNIKQQ